MDSKDVLFTTASMRLRLLLALGLLAPHLWRRFRTTPAAVATQAVVLSVEDTAAAEFAREARAQAEARRRR